MYLKTFGGLELKGSALSRPKVLLLLSYLCLEGPKDRSFLSELFYGHAANPASSLRVALKHLRDKAPNAVTVEGSRVIACCQADVTELLSAIEAQRFEEASHIYTGAFLNGFVLKDWSSELEEWVYASREYLASQLRQAMIAVAKTKASSGHYENAAELANRAFKLAGAPDPEPEQLRQLYALMLTGDSFEAGELKNLADDYGIELVLSKKEAKEQFQPVSTLSQTIRTNVVARGNSFLGRRDELGRITELLSSPDYRLLTLHGQGGIGKTRLILQTGLHFLEAEATFDGGIYFVELDALSNPEQIPNKIAQALGLALTEEDVLAQIRGFIADKPFLLLLDNFDQLVEGAAICSQLLTACPNLKLLVSSRARLNISEEYALEIKGLNVPTRANLTLEEALEYDIIKLFEDRAKHAKLEYQLSEQETEAVIMIAQLVEGLPLGIELAAAGISLMPAEEIAQSITQDLDTLYTPARDVVMRHQSLRATFDYSWNLLSEKEQAVLSSLSVCVGGFSREAASRIASANIPILRSLVDKALLRVSDTGRYSRHMLLYQFTEERLGRDKDLKVAVEGKHANYFLDLAVEAEGHLIGARQLEFLRKLETDKDNLRRALRWQLNNNPDAALRMSAALRRFWEIRGYFSEGRTWLADALNKAQDKNSETYLSALYAAGALAHKQHDIDTSEVYLNESLELAQKLGNRQVIADTLNFQAGIGWARGDLETARELLEESLEIKRELDDMRGVAVSLNNLGLLAKLKGNYDLALTLYKENLKINENLEDQRGTANALRNLALVYQDQGDLSLAKAHLQYSLETVKKLGERKIEGQLLNDLGCLACTEKSYTTATNLLNESLKIAKELNSLRDIANSFQGLGLISYAKNKFDEAAEYFCTGLSLALEANDLEGIATSLQGLASIAVSKKNPSQAAELWGASENIAGNFIAPIKYFLPKRYDQDVQNAQNLLGKREMQNLMSKGRKLSIEEAVTLFSTLEVEKPLTKVQI